MLAAAASGSAAPAASAAAPSMGGAAGGDWEDIPLTNMRRVIAQRLTESKQTVPHFYVTVECEIDSLMAVRKQLNDEADGSPLPVACAVDAVLCCSCALCFEHDPGRHSRCAVGAPCRGCHVVLVERPVLCARSV